jgi:hypothetical protein
VARPFTVAERSTLVALVQANPDMSTGELAERLKCSVRTVQHQRKRLGFKPPPPPGPGRGWQAFSAREIEPDLTDHLGIVVSHLCMPLRSIPSAWICPVTERIIHRVAA